MSDPDSELLAVFREEAKELFERLTRGLLELESANGPDRRRLKLQELFRAAHTLKGSASIVGREDFAKLTHALESSLERVRDGQIEPSRQLVDAALLTIDVLQSGLEATLSQASSARAIQALEAVPSVIAKTKPGGPNRPAVSKSRRGGRRAKHKSQEAKPPESKPSAPLGDKPIAPVVDGWVRMPVPMLDAIMYRLDELVAVKLRLDYLRRQVEQVQAALDFSSSDLHPHRRKLEPIRRELNQEVHVLGLLAQAIQDDVKEVRMVPAGPILDPLRRAVREMAASVGKEGMLEVHGEDVRIDKRHLDLMREPLMHLVRNAVDHGLEAPAERTSSGKPARGKIEISLEARDADLSIEVRDDGRGIDRTRVLEAAISRGVVDQAHAKGLTDREVMNLIFLPGFSTSKQVTELSGRGVGLDVVRDNVVRAGGRIDSYSEPGKGTQFKLFLPLTVAGSRGLMVIAGKEAYCLPLPLVDEVVAIEPAAIGVARGQLAIQWRHQAVTLVRLSDLLAQRPSERPTSRCFAAVLAVAERRLAIGVDELLGEEEIVVKGLAPGTPKLPFVAGVTSRADGKLVTVLELTAVAKAAASSSSQPLRLSGTSAPVPTILVVDDALTTRTMISLLLERSGYRTLVASDGVSALSILEGEQVDLLVTDVEMPILNGLELVRRVRASPRFSALPIILLTSLDGAVDRASGAESGANAYVMKSTFDPSNFLSMVADFVGRRGAAA